jgi:transcriptional regulator with XRE-family HTH domain
MKRPIGVPLRQASDDVHMKILAHFGERFRQWMAERRMSFVELAFRMGVSYTYLQFLGKDKPYGRLLSPENACLLAQLLGVHEDEVFSAMGQINPFLAEKVSAEELEAALIDLHRRLRRLAGEVPVAKRKAKAARRAKQAERV